MTRRWMIRSLAVLAVGAGLLLAPRSTFAQGTEPVVTLTARSAGDLIGDLHYLLKAVAPPDNPEAAQAVAALEQLKNPEALQGLDPSKPLGMFASMPAGANEPPSAVVFLPVLDPAKLLAAFEGIGATVEADETAPGFTKKVTFPGAPMPVYVAEGNGYLYLSPFPAGGDALKALSPVTLLPKRPGAGDLSLTVHLDRIPEPIKDQFAMGLEQSIAAQSARQEGEDDARFKGRIAGMNMTKDAMLSLVRDGKELALDLVIDPKTQFVGMQLNSSAVPGSPYAKALGKLAAMKSRFRGLTSNAAAGGYVSLPMSQALRDLVAQALDEGKAKGIERAKAENNPAAATLVEELTDALRPTLTAETIDLGGAIRPSATAGDSLYSLAGGVAVKDGAKIEAALRSALKSTPEDKKKGITLDAAKAADGTTIHKFTDPDGNDAKQLGEPTAYVAIRNDVAAVGVGKDGQNALNAVLGNGKAASGDVAPQVEMFVATSKVAGLADNKERAEAMKAAAKEIFSGDAATKDRISMTLTAQGAAMTLRLGADIPALKFLGRVNPNAEKAGQ